METILPKQALFMIHLSIFMPSQVYQKNDFENLYCAV
tara:strand:+ start:1636 stop:1746 length:111 start_codon:yes stop_codon:yes gene_type:complete